MRAAAGPALQASAAAGAAWYLAHDVVGHADPFFAPVAAAVALGTSHIQRARRTLQMVVGVLLGIGVSELLHPAVGAGPIGIAFVVMAVVVLVVAVSGGFVGEGMMFFNQAASAAVLVIALHRTGTGAERATDALIGGAVALFIGVGLVPADPLKLLAQAERRVLRSLLAILEQCHRLAPGVHVHDTDVDWELTASHDVHVQLARLALARSSARVAVRVAPRRIRLRATVDREEARVSQLHLLAGSVLSLMRTIVDVREYGEPPAEGSADDIDRLAGAVRVLQGASLPWEPTVVQDVNGRLGHLAAGSLVRTPADGAVVPLAARRVARDVLRVLSPAA